MYFGYIGDIRMFAGVRTPEFWMLCQGQMLKIDDYPKLHKVLGTTYGGDGTTSFALPDFRGRLAVHIGTGSNLTPWTGGEKKGEAAVTLTADAIPPHTHTLYAVNREGGQRRPRWPVIRQNPGREVPLSRVRCRCGGPHGLFRHDGRRGGVRP